MSMPVEIVEAQEVLKPGQRSLRELADAANREHALVLEAGGSMVEHAIRAGGALLEAQEQIPGGEWSTWLADNFAESDGTARLYMRLSCYQDQVRESGIDGIVAARTHLAQIGAPARRKGPKVRLPQWMRDAARDMRADGMSTRAISLELGVSTPTVLRWTDPEQAKRQAAAVHAARRKRRAALRLLEEQERQQAIKRAVRKAGAATQEAWAMAERMQDVLAQAQRETEDRVARRALSEAGAHHRKMRDEIVRALGVS